MAWLICISCGVLASKGLYKNVFNFSINPTPHQYVYAYFKQFDWLKKKFYTSINSMRMNIRIIFLPPAPKMCSNVDKNKIMITT